MRKKMVATWVCAMLIVSAVPIFYGQDAAGADSPEAVPLAEPQPPRGDYVVSEPFRINSNADFATSPKVTGGDGSAGNPWIIENYDINGAGYGYCIYIGNTTDYFVVRNCYLHEASGMSYWIYYPDSGLVLSNVRNGQLANNTVTNNYDGIILALSDGNTIANNTINSNGIRLFSSCGNTLSNNTMVDDGIYISGGQLQHWNTHNIDTSNTVNAKPLYYWKNQTGGTVPLGAGQIILANCTYVTVENQNVSDGSIGILLGFSGNNTIANNIASSNNYGIWLGISGNNTIANNTVSSNYHNGIYLTSSSDNSITNNIANSNNDGIMLFSSNCNTIVNNIANSNKYVGIELVSSICNIIINNTISLNVNYGFGISFYSDNNYIYHNSIINNARGAYDQCVNAWHNGYPSGGNYWSDYAGIDATGGPNQDIPGADGIGDTPYTNIAGGAGAQDDYPLMESIGTKPPMASRAPFRINSNADFPAYANGGGDGSAGNPWIIENYYINGSGYGYCIYIGNTTEHFVVRNCYLHDASGASDWIYYCDSGLLLFNARSGIITNVTSSSNEHGIKLDSTHDTMIIDNIISTNHYGIFFRDTTTTSISNSNISGCYIGLYFLSANVNKKTSNNSVSGCKIHTNYYGVLFQDYSWFNTIHNNEIFLNEFGIRFDLVSTQEFAPRYNVIKNCEIKNNTNTGISTWYSSNNSIYHNNIVNNAVQAFAISNYDFWDNGYPSGGNFWSDYNGTDIMYGPNQDIPASDGIGDTPYTDIAGTIGSQDKYPLMQPFNGTEIAPPVDTTPPIADAGPDQNVTSGTLVTFDGSSSIDNAAIDNFTWTFTYNGTAVTLYGVSPTFQFWTVENYTVTLTVHDAAGNFDADTMRVKVVLAIPLANAGPDQNVVSGTLVTFNGSASTDDLGIDNYTWTFAYNGTAAVLYGVSPTFRFWTVGNYTATLTVRDADKNSDTDTMQVTVIPLPPLADTTSPVADAGSDQRVSSGDTVTFSGAASTDNVGVANYTWTFTYNGTNVTLYGVSPTFRLWAAGEYTVTLTVRDAAGNTATDTMTVKVTSGGSGGGNDLMWIILIIIIVGVVVAVLLMLFKRGKSPAPVIGEMPAQPPPEQHIPPESVPAPPPQPAPAPPPQSAAPQPLTREQRIARLEQSYRDGKMSGEMYEANM